MDGRKSAADDGRETAEEVVCPCGHPGTEAFDLGIPKLGASMPSVRE